ncbi:MAG: putative transposase, partial [Mycobacterium sp.]|nr:putative transposase [Mycobacterium sp.]
MCAQPVEDARDRCPVAGSVGTDVSTELHPPRWAPLNRPARYSRPHTLVGCVRRRCISSMNSPRPLLVTGGRKLPTCCGWSGSRSAVGDRSYGVGVRMRYRYRIESTPAQKMELARVFGCCRLVFNDALRVRDEAHRAGVKLSDTEIQRRVITQAKTTVERCCVDGRAQCGTGASGQRLSPGLAELLRLSLRQAEGTHNRPAEDEVEEGPSPVV